MKKPWLSPELKPPQRAQAGRCSLAHSIAGCAALCDDLVEKFPDVTLVDSFAVLDANHDKLMRGDLLHPNGDGNRAIARVWFDAIQARAEKPAR